MEDLKHIETRKRAAVQKRAALDPLLQQRHELIVNVTAAEDAIDTQERTLKALHADHKASPEDVECARLDLIAREDALAKARGDLAAHEEMHPELRQQDLDLCLEEQTIMQKELRATWKAYLSEFLPTAEKLRKLQWDMNNICIQARERWPSHAPGLPAAAGMIVTGFPPPTFEAGRDQLCTFDHVKIAIAELFPDLFPDSDPIRAKAERNIAMRAASAAAVGPPTARY